MMIQSKTNNHLYGLHSFAFPLTSYGIHSTKDNVRKNKLFLQNKANFQKVKFNVNRVLTKDYDLMDTWSIRKTKPIQSQSKPIQSQFKPIKANIMPKQSQFKPKRTQNTEYMRSKRYGKNKPTSIISCGIA